MIFSARDLEQLFNQTFLPSHNTELVGGADEPLYQPALKSGDTHKIFYREDFFRSALHEIAHWCIAGEQRRKQVDYGYWYEPDGRSAEQQQLFEQAEYRPQALEWLFAVAAGHSFRLSADNLAVDPYTGASSQPSLAFRQRVQQCVVDWCQGAMPERGYQFIQALQTFYGGGDALLPIHYQQLPK